MSVIPILFEDAEALVIGKPEGLPIDRPRTGGASLGDHLDAFRLGFRRRPVPVHRLDADTSGCLLLARNPRALARLSRAFEERRAQKTYLGLVAGEPAEECGTIDLALAKVSSARSGWRMIPARKGKPAITHWQRIATSNGISLIRFTPVTGRTHQIRAHAAAGLGFALLGDRIYGPPDPRAPRTMLHAAMLEVPREGRPPVRALAPLPADFGAFGLAPSDD